MPPSNFFNTTVEVEDTDEESGDVTDFESIPDICSTTFPQIRLKWHYRSRYEQLISFSNKNFYDNDLITFPSVKTDRPWIGVDYHYVDGTFDHRSKANRKEPFFIKNLETVQGDERDTVIFSVGYAKDAQPKLFRGITYGIIKPWPSPIPRTGRQPRSHTRTADHSRSFT